jgi:hypothetical protein
MTNTEKVTFQTGGAFLRDTRVEVERLLSAPQARLRATRRLYFKAPIAVGLILSSWTVLLFASRMR